MLKLNNKGMTTAEILVSFILVAIISTSLYTTFSNYSRKMERESNKLEINKFKNILTKQIQDDIIKGGLINAKIREFHTEKTLADGTKAIDPTNPDDIYIVDLVLKDHTIKRLAVRRRLAEYYTSEEIAAGAEDEKSKVDDFFEIYYGNPENQGIETVTKTTYMKGLEKFNIPDLGEGENDQTCDVPTNRKCIVKDFRITNVLISNENKVLSIFIGFQHIEEGTKYAINIVSPIDYQPSINNS